ncbi:hypothetical protein M2281_003677 [Mesorhizobium soli]|nr:hypothetical protein [Mesorhizobium soli]
MRKQCLANRLGGSRNEKSDSGFDGFPSGALYDVGCRGAEERHCRKIENETLALIGFAIEYRADDGGRSKEEGSAET